MLASQKYVMLPRLWRQCLYKCGGSSWLGIFKENVKRVRDQTWVWLLTLTSAWRYFNLSSDSEMSSSTFFSLSHRFHTTTWPLLQPPASRFSLYGQNCSAWTFRGLLSSSYFNRNKNHHAYPEPTVKLRTVIIHRQLDGSMNINNLIRFRVHTAANI